MSAPFRIRPARLPDDKPAILNFLMGIQLFEKPLEPDRRIDSIVAEDSYAAITERVAKKDGCFLIAEDTNGGALGWAAVHQDDNNVYVVAEERTYGHIAELYVTEDARGQGVGRALIAACEDWARQRGLKVMMLGVLPGNTHADRIYKRMGYADYVVLKRKYL
jgi:GNAT superfamily N-acetyltransferase